MEARTSAEAIDEYQKWLTSSVLPIQLRQELTAIANQPDEIQDRFYRDLEFGTGGLRGILGAGTNRMNVFTVRKATFGLGKHVLAKGNDHGEKGVIIGFDCRRFSKEFSEECGRVLAELGIRSYVFPSLCPTPVLSYAVRALGASAGIMITASHNPPEYNGYKVYDDKGCQVLTEEATKILEQIEAVEDVFTVPVADLKDALASGRMKYVPDEVTSEYVSRVVRDLSSTRVTETERNALSIVFSPLHGTGNIPVQEVLKCAGYTNCHVVPNQTSPDGEFPTVKSPNPEEKAAFTEALKVAKEVRADVVLATDPDADRVGVATLDASLEYQLLSGNQTGALLVDYVLSTLQEQDKMPAGATVLKTIVTSEFGREVAESYGVIVEDTLTGFKYIGDRIEQYLHSNERTFVFGYEESYGYLAAPFVRDKDAVQICLLVAEMCAYYKGRGQSLLDALHALYRRVGYFEEQLLSVTLAGIEGTQQIHAMMQSLRSNPLVFQGMTLCAVEDYESLVRTEYTWKQTYTKRITLPKSSVIKLVFDDGCWIAVRPSGTEPKIKFYIGVKGQSSQQCAARMGLFADGIKEYLKAWL